MRDPYDVLGVSRGASFDAVKAAYRRACKAKHPDMGGSHEEFVELGAAYDFILSDLKRGYEQRREEARREQAEPAAGFTAAPDDDDWQHVYRDVEDELEELRRTARAYEEALRTARAAAWDAGDRAVWARLTWADLARFIGSVARSGVKGMALIVAALIGVGSILVDANVVSAFLILGSGIGLVLSLALKSDKGGYLAAGLLLFGVMTIWLPPVRAALFHYPLATVSVLLCLGLVFKFAQGGIAGWMTGGVLALYVIVVIVGDNLPKTVPPAAPTAAAPRQAPPVQNATMTPRPQPVPRPSAPVIPASLPPTPAATPAPPPAPRTLLAARGAVLKFVAGVPYQLKVRTGFTTEIEAATGTIALWDGDRRTVGCATSLKLAMPPAAMPYRAIDRTIRACGGDAVFRVIDLR